MSFFRELLAAWLVLTAISSDSVSSDPWKSTRVIDPSQHARLDTRSYPFRTHVKEILQELDLQRGDVVVDIGAGKGWWAERMADAMGREGIVYAAEA